MIKENIFVGEIRSRSREIFNKKSDGLDTYYNVHEQDKIEKSCAVLYKCYENKYLEITPQTTLIDVKLAEADMSDKVISTTPIVGEKYVKEDSLVPYYNNLEDKKIYFKKLRNNLLVDPRLNFGPRDLEW